MVARYNLIKQLRRATALSADKNTICQKERNNQSKSHSIWLSVIAAYVPRWYKVSRDLSADSSKPNFELGPHLEHRCLIHWAQSLSRSHVMLAILVGLPSILPNHFLTLSTISSGHLNFSRHGIWRPSCGRSSDLLLPPIAMQVSDPPCHMKREQMHNIFHEKLPTASLPFFIATAKGSSQLLLSWAQWKFSPIWGVQSSL